MSRFLGVARDALFSPGKVEADRQILDMTAQHLRDAGHAVEVFVETEPEWPRPARDTVVFTMSQGAIALQRLSEWEQQGTRVINRPQGILNCQRDRTVALLADAGVGFPRTVVVGDLTSPELPSWVDDAGAWIKRGDVHAIVADDVVAVTNRDEACLVLAQMGSRGIQRAAVQENRPGAVVKFYGTRNGFFHAVPPSDSLMIGEEVAQRIDAVGRRAAALLDVEIYGGDCIIAAAGGLSLIDLNDWPSYSACRFRASQFIADYLQEVVRS